MKCLIPSKVQVLTHFMTNSNYIIRNILKMVSDYINLTSQECGQSLSQQFWLVPDSSNMCFFPLIAHHD